MQSLSLLLLVNCLASVISIRVLIPLQVSQPATSVALPFIRSLELVWVSRVRKTLLSRFAKIRKPATDGRERKCSSLTKVSKVTDFSLFTRRQILLVSMVDGDLFDKLAEIGSILRKSPLPFGGIQVGLETFIGKETLANCSTPDRCYRRLFPAPPCDQVRLCKVCIRSYILAQNYPANVQFDSGFPTERSRFVDS